MKYPFRILNKKKFVLCFVIAFVANIFFYITPALLAYFTREPFTLEKLKYLIISIVVTKVFAVSLNQIWIMYILKFENIYAKDLQLAYFKRVIRMKPFQLNKVHNGFLKKQIDIISEEAEELLEQIFETVSGFSVSVVMFLTQVFAQDKNMFFLCLAMIIGMVIYNFLLGKKIVLIQENYNETYSKYNSTYVDFLQNVKTIKRLNASEFANQKNEKLYQQVLPKLDKLNLFYSFRSNGINTFVYIMYTIVLINLYVRMQANENILPSLLFYVTIFDMLRTELKDLTFLFIHFNRFQAATNQVEKMVGEESDKLLIKDWHTIQIHDLEFRYSKESKTKIHIPHFEIHKGDKISIVGKSGQGKSTFLNIFARYIEVDDKCYTMDGENKSGNLDLAYISQEIDLFDLTVKENLCLGKEIPEDVLMKILTEAGLREWVEKLEAGLQTVVIVTHREEIKKICKKHYIFQENQMREETFEMS